LKTTSSTIVVTKTTSVLRSMVCGSLRDSESVVVTPDPVTNKLFVQASEENMELVRTRVAELDNRVAQLLQSERITTVGTGCDCPLIDLSDVCDACNEAARGCELVILEGMGRAIETNYHIPFNCDAIHLAMIKNPHVARWIGCEMFDLIARFTPANSPPPPR